MFSIFRQGIRVAVAAFALVLLLQFLVPQRVSAAPTTTLSLQKFVAVNSGPYGTSAAADDGDTLTYALQYANTGSNSATSASITDTLQPGQTLQAVTPGCTQGMSGGLVVVTCPLGDVPPSGSANSSGTVFIQTTVNTGFSGNIANTGHISALNATTQNSNTTNVCVGAGCTPGNVTLEKYVSDNGSAYGTSMSANFGDFLTYDLKFTNVSGSTLNGVVVTDTLQPGQNLVGFPSSSCVYNSGTSTVSCSLGNVPNNTIVRAFIETQVNTGGPATITNQGAASWSSTTINSNTTTVTVPSSSPTTFGTFTLCGYVNSYTPAGSGTGSITISDVTVTIAAGTTPNGPIATGSNLCVTFAFNASGQANVLSVSPNLSVIGAACGFYSSTGTAGTISVSGIIINVAAGASFMPFLQPGAFYCFLLTSGGQAYAAISGVPTSVTFATRSGNRYARIAV